MDTTPPVFHQVRMAQLAAAAHAVYEKEHPFEGSKRGAAYTAWKDRARRSVLQTIQPQQQAAREDPDWILSTDFHMPESHASKAALMRMMPSTAYCLEDFDYPPNLLRPGVKRPRSQRPGRNYEPRAEALKAWEHQQENKKLQDLKASKKQEEVQQAALRREQAALRRLEEAIQQEALRKQQVQQQEALRKQQVQHDVRRLLQDALGDMHLAELRQIARYYNQKWWKCLEGMTHTDQEASEHMLMAVEEWRTKRGLNEEWGRWYEAELSASPALREALTDFRHLQGHTAPPADTVG
jgi:RNase P/RNase MRP subunit POP5